MKTASWQRRSPAVLTHGWVLDERGKVYSKSEIEKARAAGIILSAVETYFAQNPGSQLSLVRITLFDQPTLQAFLHLWDAPSRPSDPLDGENS